MTAEKVDVLICGSGSAGLCAATWFAKRGLNCKVLESRHGPLLRGQADGVQCRTVEIFQSFGLSEVLLRDSYHVLETTFWSRTGGRNGIVRLGRTADTQPGLSHQPHVIYNQALLNGLLLNAMQKFNGQGVEYGVTVKQVEVDESTVKDPKAFCVKVLAEKNGSEVEFNARYVLGCDGAHSAVRKSLGIKMVGDSTNHVWGVMDVYALTDFPDVRRKVTIKTNIGSLLIIPREGGSLTRFYVELSVGIDAKAVKLEDLQASIRNILSPYSVQFCETVWWSAYSIGQRVADRFTIHDRIFLTGDACHTHSPKSGQGMNTSLQDGYNLGWKLAAVLKEESPTRILGSYAVERAQVANALIDFDREFAKSFSSTPEATGGNATSIDAFIRYFIWSGTFTAGLATRYQNSIITMEEIQYKSAADLATGLTIGMRFPSAQVVRYCDARAMQLAQTLISDGRWRIVIFAGNILKPDAWHRLNNLATFLNSDESPVRRCTPAGADIDSIIECIVVLSGTRLALELDQIPGFFLPHTGQFGLRSLEKIFVDDESYNSGHGNAYEFYGCSKEMGCITVVRPDQHVSAVTGIEQHNVLKDFFASCLLPASK